jgi:hypothetical protein
MMRPEREIQELSDLIRSNSERIEFGCNEDELNNIMGFSAGLRWALGEECKSLTIVADSMRDALRSKPK